MQQIHAAICTPIQSPDGVIGVIYADNVQSEKSLTRDDLKLVAAIGVITGIAIRNARLVERLKNEKAALEESHVALKTAQDQLVQSEKLAVTGQLASGIVHDLKNPMTILQGNADLMSELLAEATGGKVEVGELRELLKHMQQGIEHACAVTNNLLTYVRPTDSHPEPLTIGPLVDSCLGFIRGEAYQAGVTLTAALDDTLPAVLADANRIKQVLINLILNAVQAIDSSNGFVRIAGTPVQVHGEHMVRLSVTDNGQGMTDEEQDRMFEPFYSTKTPGKGSGGTGLGLSVSRSIIERHGGHLWAESAKGSGTTMYVDLPVAPVTSPLPAS